MDTTQIPKPKRFFLYDTDRNRFVELTPYLAAGFVLGREEGNETFPDDDTMSHCHARLSFDETGAIQLEDLGATNGTRLNDVALTKGEKRRVALHDRVGVGRQEFILTNQNQYRPVAAGKIKDLTLVAQAAAQDQYEPPPAPPADPDATVVHPVRVRYRPPREKRPGLPKLSPQALALGAVLLAVAAV
ncbi:MAG: FHA domain-containing protein, partial [Oligoflexia bacterium]|nr:FHA domain-containing protein [Oligoflexia bacterium]